MGSPFLNPKDMTLTFSGCRVPTPPNRFKSSLRSLAVENAVVSSTKSDLTRTGSSSSRSRFTASSMEPPSVHSGWVRRVSL